MNVPMEVTVPLDMVVVLRDRLKALVGVTEKELGELQKQIKKGDTKAFDRRAVLVQRLTFLSERNLLRLVVLLGMETFAQVKNDALLKKITESGVRPGRKPHLKAVNT